MMTPPQVIAFLFAVVSLAFIYIFFMGAFRAVNNKSSPSDKSFTPQESMALSILVVLSWGLGAISVISGVLQ